MKSETIYYFIEFLFEMTSKELRARYKKTIFGFLWMIINPTLQMLVIGLIFNFFIKNPIENYFMFLFVGLLTWNFFTLSLTKGTTSIFDQRDLVKKAYFPRMILPLSIILSNYVHYLLGLSLLFLLLIILGKLVISSLVYFLLTQTILLIFIVGLCLFTSSANVRYRDVNFFVQALLIIWFYATPIFYNLSFIPDELQWIWYLNPLTGIIQLLQYIFVQSQLPSTGGLMINITTSLIVFAIGIISFSKQSKYFDDWI